MTSRERLTAVLKGETADRTPVAPYVYDNTVKEWKQDLHADIISGTLEFCENYGFDCILRNFGIRHDDLAGSDESWNVDKSETNDGRIKTIQTEIKTPEGTLSQTVRYTQITKYLNVSAYTEHFIKCPEDFALLKRYQPKPVPPDLRELRRAKALIGNRGVIAPWTWGVFNYMSNMRSLNDLLTDPYLEPDFYHDLAQYAQERLMTALEPVLSEGVDLLSYTGNVAGGTMVGPKYFMDYVYCYEKPLIDYIQNRCIGIIYHNCGDADSMINCYNALSPVCYESMTEPPFADNSLEKCLNGFDKNITLMGNIDQIDFLKKANAEAVYERAGKIVDLAASRGHFILGTSDFLEEGTPSENLYALARAVL